MKIKMVFIAALAIACTAGYSAEETYTAGTNSVAIPRNYREVPRTGTWLIPTPGDSVFSYEGATDPIATPILSGEQGDPVFIQSDGQEKPFAPDNEIASIFTQDPDSVPTVFGSFSGNTILFWAQEPTNTNHGSSATIKVQIIVLEPESEWPYDIAIPEYSDLISDEPAWYEWANPRLFLTKWADYWLYETNATPVVLVSFSF